MFVATTGQGAPPFPMRPLWKDMMKKGYKLEDEVKFAIYSLGDRGYGDNFAMAARKLRQRMKMLGAEQLIEIGLGDDQDPQGYRETYLSGWGNELLSVLKPLTKQGKGSNLTVNLRDFTTECQFQLKAVQQLSSRKGRKVLWVELEFNGASVTEGDVVEIFPHNRPH